MKWFVFILFFVSPLLYADALTIDPPLIWNTRCIPCIPPTPWPCCLDGIVVDLLNPTYEDGTLFTDEGGVLVAPGLRIQAQTILCIRQLEEAIPVFCVTCDGDIVIDYQDWVLVGDRFYYDFITHTGYITCGKSASPPWYLGGDEILLLDNGNIQVINGYLTTSEGPCKDLLLCSNRITMTPNRIVTASHLKVKVNRIPLLWLPYLAYDLKNIGRSPFAVKFGWGGFMGSHLSLLYRFLALGDFQGIARFDAFIGHGIGAGIETVYDPKFALTQFYTRNYWAHDLAIFDRERRNRYRFQGTYFDCLYGVTIDGMYDFVSDGEMAADYQTKDFELYTAGRTQLALRHQEPGWLANLFTRIRVNDFQSVNQELPSFQMQIHPFEIGESGFIFENLFKASYLSFVFSDEIHARDFRAGRFAVYPSLYRPIAVTRSLMLTPEAGFIGIGYTNSPGGKSAGQALGELGMKAEGAFSKTAAAWKHVIEPYAHYRFLTHPRVGTDKHFIFSISDGYDYLNILRFGVRNALYLKGPCLLFRPLWIDIWANAFFATSTVGRIIPKAYLTAEFDPHARLFIFFETGWNFTERQLDFYNTRIEWTLSESLAFAAEYRHRSRFDWRKADFYNFILESTRTIEDLEDSALSDRRDIFLFRTFLRPDSDWTFKFEWRNGWNRKDQKPFREYQIEAQRSIYEHWRLGFNYEKRMADNRYSFFLRLDPGPPSKGKACLCR